MKTVLFNSRTFVLQHKVKYRDIICGFQSKNYKILVMVDVLR